MDKDLELRLKRLYRRNEKADATDEDESFFPFLKTKEDSNTLFPVLSKRDKITPLVPHLTEMAGIKPLFPDNLEMLDNLRSKSIPGYSIYGELTTSRLLRNPAQMGPSVDFLNRLKRNRFF